MKITPLRLYILAHLRRAGIDYAKSISKTLKHPQSNLIVELEYMENSGYIEKTHGSAVKRTEARFKLSYEVRKHHTYYRLTKEGEMLLKKIKNNLEAYFKDVTGNEKSFEIFTFLIKAEYEHAGFIAKSFSMSSEQVGDLLTKLINLGLIEQCKPRTLKRKHRKAKPKKETRTQHMYYRPTRLGNMLMRYIK
jgi:predicted transcriptional regulator